MYFQPVPVGLEPRPHLSIFVVGGVVLNQNCSLAVIAPGELFEKAQVRYGIKNRLLAIIKPCSPEFDGSKDLHVLALAGDGNFGRLSYAAPGGVERRILPEAGFVGEEERPVSRAGFFLSAG